MTLFSPLCAETEHRPYEEMVSAMELLVFISTCDDYSSNSIAV